jgi:NTP pyrophosphatase (non-canonical NTP hydrolase)
MYTMDNYQSAASKFRNNDLGPFEERMMCVLGLASEAGEIAEAIKHAEFHGHNLDHDNLKKELGDLLWYIAALCNHYGWSLDTVAGLNIDKLSKRYPKGFESQRSINRVEHLQQPFGLAGGD